MTNLEVINCFKSEVKACIEFNQPFSSATQNLSERICSNIFGFRINAKKGYSFDTSKNDELKSCTYLQPKTCKSCGESNHFFSKNCICGLSDLTLNNEDSRWQIGSSSHFKHFDYLNRYIVTLTRYENGKIIFEGWIIDKNNEHFNFILKNQNELSKSDGLNFNPFSHDFFRCDPILFTHIEIDMKSDVVVENTNIENTKVFKLKKEHFSFNSKILSVDEMVLLLGLEYKNKSKKVLLNKIFTEDSIKLSDLNIPKRIKDLNRRRGLTKR
jgi:hypothetical protein